MNEFMNELKKDSPNPTYSCGICGKIHTSIEQRMECEQKCLAERKKAEAALAKQKLDEEKAKDRKEILDLYNTLEDKLSKYLKKYGNFDYVTTNAARLNQMFDTLFEKWWG